MKISFSLRKNFLLYYSKYQEEKFIWRIFFLFLDCLCCWPLMLYNFMPLHTFHFFFFSFLFPHSSFSCFGMVGWESSCDMRNVNDVRGIIFCGLLLLEMYRHVIKCASDYYSLFSCLADICDLFYNFIFYYSFKNQLFCLI